MKLLTEAAMWCVMTVAQPDGCMPASPPPIRLTQAPCPFPGGQAWKLASWAGDNVCWRRAADGDIDLAGGARVVQDGMPETQCAVVRCKVVAK